ncbi:hypothetical protein BCEN4_590052 [Burkholderia cenocepacia]|uniref:hypothetical protein n=1 Tax=Burkholderia cepacia complex TaxID=87882 RepID=UPI0015909A79|nr:MULTISPECIES: hypothetical protein [Burkholderia cepacia complex]CAD9226722.1 hypothetical protein BCEN4_590052 [Burkholderia cenocepacia]
MPSKQNSNFHVLKPGGTVFNVLKSIFSRNISSNAKADRGNTQSLRFADNEAAFGYACEYIDTTIREEAFIPAIVTRVDKSPKGDTWIALRIASPDRGFEWISAPRDPSMHIQAGDLAIFWVGQTTPVLTGLVVDTVYPELHPTRGWKIKR